MMTPQINLPRKQHSFNTFPPLTHLPDCIHNQFDMDNSLMVDSDLNRIVQPTMMRSKGSFQTALRPLPSEEILLTRKTLMERLTNPIEIEGHQTRSDDCMKMICLGMNASPLPDNLPILAAKPPAKSFRLLDRISPMSNDPFNSHSRLQQVSQPPNGITSYEGLLSTSTMSSHLSTTSHLLKRSSRECQGFVTPCRCNIRASEGTGTGWDLVSLAQPVPVGRDSRAGLQGHAPSTCVPH